MKPVVELVRQGQGQYEFATVVSQANGYTLEIKVFRDAMKFNEVPWLKYNRTPDPDKQETRDGVRLPASAYELQEIADLLNCSLLTPKIIDLIWLQAGLRFNAVIQSGGKIVAVSDIHAVHDDIEAEIQKQGGDNGTQLISCVGKYWCLVNELAYKGKTRGAWTACNYGWCSTRGSGPGLTPGVKCWQRPGFKHGGVHLDPSQTIRLMHKKATLTHPDGTSEEKDILDIAQDPKLADLVSHQGPLRYLRQRGAEPQDPIVDPNLNPEVWKPGPLNRKGFLKS